MIIISNVTTNGNFSWSNETLQGSGNFTKNDNGEIIQLYFNGSYKNNPNLTCQLNANRSGNNGTFYFNISCDDLQLIIAFSTNALTIIEELSLINNENENTEQSIE